MDSVVRPIVGVDRLVKTYAARHVVDGVSFSVSQGEFVSLLGPSGSGKTTVLRMIAGLVRPDGGAIQMEGQTVAGAGIDVSADRRNVGMVFQDLALWPHMTVDRNIAFGLRLRHQDRRVIRARVEELLDLVNLPGLGARYPHQLSGGQQQRVALARALAPKPRTLLLDEPLSSLDSGLRETMREEIVRVAHITSTTVINVTHDQSEAMAVSDRIILLRAGRIEQVGAPQDLYRAPMSLFAARFMGPLTVIHGVVDGTGNGRRGLVSNGRRLTAVTASDNVGSMGALVCRPEDALLLEEEPSREPNRLPARVTRIAFLDGRWVMRLAIADGVEVTAVSARKLPLNSAVWLALPPERCRLVDADDSVGITSRVDQSGTAKA